MLVHKISSHYSSASSESLSQLSLSLFERQRMSWSMLSQGVDALNSVRVRTFDHADYSVRLQFNPKRIVSTGAKVDAQSIRERKCFLCVNHLPEEQRGVLWYEKFIVLCNPMPIFRHHYTISHVEHIPQSIEENILPFLDLAEDFSVSHSVFYNGPKCGASAPDHMHFQASPKGSIPVELDAMDPIRRKYHADRGAVKLYSLANYDRGVVVLESANKQDLELCFLRLVGAMRKVFSTNEEPMMNVICSFDGGMWRLIVFPRSKHRPDVYFKSDGEQVLISPAAVDIGGLIVTPVEKDFTQVDIGTVAQIFREVSINNETLHSILAEI